MEMREETLKYIASHLERHDTSINSIKDGVLTEWIHLTA